MICPDSRHFQSESRSYLVRHRNPQRLPRQGDQSETEDNLTKPGTEGYTTKDRPLGPAFLVIPDSLEISP